MNKFTDTLKITEWEVLTDTGFVDIKCIGKTIPFEMWRIETLNYYLECADIHIIFDDNYNEVYVKDCFIGLKILTETGIEIITNIINIGYKEYMYDLQLCENSNSRYYTNGILSHNSRMLGNLVAHSILNGYNSLLITLELREKRYLRRIGSNLLNIPIDDYDTISNDSEKMGEILRRFRELNTQTLRIPGELSIKEYGASSAGVNEIEVYLKKMESLTDKKIKIVFVDYINLMKNWRNPNTENTYMKIKQIAEDLRSFALRNEVTVVTLTQLNRQASNSSTLSLSDISESMGLAATVDALFGIITPDVMDERDGKFYIQALALRDADGIGEKQMFKVDKNYMRIIQSTEFTKSELPVQQINLKQDIFDI